MLQIPSNINFMMNEDKTVSFEDLTLYQSYWAMKTYFKNKKHTQEEFENEVYNMQRELLKDLYEENY